MGVSLPILKLNEKLHIDFCLASGYGAWAETVEAVYSIFENQPQSFMYISYVGICISFFLFFFLFLLCETVYCYDQISRIDLRKG